MEWHEAVRKTWSDHLDEKTEWGALDCCQFVREYVKNLTGKDYGSQFQYSSEFEAMSILDDSGDLVSLITGILGEPGELSPGAVVVARVPAGLVAGIWQGSYVIGVHTTDGVVRFRAQKIEGAWPCHRL